MEWMDMLVAVVGLVVGWFLNEISKRFQLSRERQGHIGRALSNLLELHHRIRAVEHTIHHLSQQFELSDDAEHVLRPLLQQVIPQSDECVARYEDAIEQLSESDPLSAFELRTTGRIPHMLATLSSILPLHGASASDMALMEKQLKEMLIPSLVAAIRELARLHGYSTKKRIEAYLDAPLQMPAEAQAFLQNIKLEEQKKLAAQAAVVKPT